MKYAIRILGTFGFALAMFLARKAPAAESSFLDYVTVAPVAAITQPGLTGAGVFSTGLDLGVGVNKFVSIHATAMASESDNWGGSVIDESEFYGKATFARFAKETFTLYGKGGAVRNWGRDLWGFGVGAGAELRLSKNVSLAADYTIRAWFHEQDYDGQIRGLVNIRF